MLNVAWNHHSATEHDPMTLHTTDRNDRLRMEIALCCICAVHVHPAIRIDFVMSIWISSNGFVRVWPSMRSPTTISYRSIRAQIEIDMSK